MKDSIGVGLTIIGGVWLLLATTGCTAVNQFARRSEAKVAAVASNAVTNGAERSVTTTLTLHGNNRDVLAAYKDALDFTLEKVLGIK